MKLLTSIILLVCALAMILASPVGPAQPGLLQPPALPSLLERARRSPHKYSDYGGGYPSYPSQGGGGCNTCGGGSPSYPSGGSQSWSSAQASASSGSASRGYGKK